MKRAKDFSTPTAQDEALAKVWEALTPEDKVIFKNEIKDRFHRYAKETSDLVETKKISKNNYSVVMDEVMRQHPEFRLLFQGVLDA